MSVPGRPAPAGATRVFGAYLDRLARRAFATVRWRSRTAWQDWDPAIPVLAVANHTGWWDGFLSHQVSRAMGWRFRILMEAEHLARYRTFRRFGAMPVERRDPRQAMRDLELAEAELQPWTMVWIYPQGSRRPAAEPLVHLEHGAGWMIRRHEGPLRVLPVAFRYAFLSEQRPEAFALLGDPWLAEGIVSDDRRAITGRLGEMLARTIAELDAGLADERLEGFATLIAGRLSINNRLDRVRHALGLLPDHQARNG